MFEYDSDTLNEINRSVNLVEYIGQKIDLKPRSKVFFGSCPLHSDSTPSFAIYPEDNRFYCFSCGRSGGIIQYLKDYEGYGFNEAVTRASELAKIDLSNMCCSQTVLFNKQITKAKSVWTPYKHPILDKKIYAQYIKIDVPEWESEGIRPEEIELFEIRYDRCSNRIVYPVYDTHGNFINIKGRTRFPDYKKMGIAKYMNYYPVGVMDYFQGANVTLPFVKAVGEAIVFEGIKSVMKLFGNNIKNSISAEKHTLTYEQKRWLVEQSVDIVFAYDSDVDYRNKDVKSDIDFLKQFTNVYIIKDKDGLLGGEETKNSPIDCGIDIWNELYKNKMKVR